MRSLARYASILAMAILLAVTAAEGGKKKRGKQTEPVPTGNAVLEQFMAALALERDGDPGRWRVRYDGRRLTVLTDEAHDRMRIVAPVATASGLTEDDLRVLLEANFDRALDAKYAIYEGAVWSTFVHPLSSLTRGEFESALSQVVTLADTYGSTYTSTNLMFGEPPGQDNE